MNQKIAKVFRFNTLVKMFRTADVCIGIKIKLYSLLEQLTKDNVNEILALFDGNVHVHPDSSYCYNILNEEVLEKIFDAIHKNKSISGEDIIKLIKEEYNRTELTSILLNKTIVFSTKNVSKTTHSDSTCGSDLAEITDVISEKNHMEDIVSRCKLTNCSVCLCLISK